MGNVLNSIKQKLGFGVGDMSQQAPKSPEPKDTGLRVTDVPGVTKTSPIVKAQNALFERKKQLDAIK